MYVTPFINLPGFRKYDNEKFEHVFPDNNSSLEYYLKFKESILNGRNTGKYIPVMRMCDGEYIYSVGKKKGFYQNKLAIVKNFSSNYLLRQTTSWGENYTRVQNRDLKAKFPQILRFIAEHGYIANHFLYNPSHFCEQYIQPMIKWYGKHGIPINSDCYTAFYFVYVLLNGPDSLELFKNSRVLILTSFPEEKRQSVRTELHRRGATNVYFHSISATRSMLDKLDLSTFYGLVDIVLIAAGIGSANILVQCEPLKVPCIDSGFCLECLANSAVRQDRIYGVPDQEF